MSPVDLLLAQKAVLEGLFGADWFTEQSYKKQNHSAFRSWSLCAKLLRQKGILQWPEDKAFLPDIASTFLTIMHIVGCSGGDLQKLALGSFANYGDQNVKKRILTSVKDSYQFLDIMTELAYAAWHISNGHDLVALGSENESKPDFVVTLAGVNLPIAADCKRIRADSLDQRFAKIVKKANKQIKSLNSDCYGLVVLDISAKVSIPDALTDDLPKEVEQISEILRRAINRKNSSVSAVLLVWNDAGILGTPGQTLRTSVFVRRHSLLLRHSNPKHTLPDNIVLTDYGFTAMFSVNWSPRSETIVNPIDNPLSLTSAITITFSELFEKEIESEFRISKKDVRRALVQPDRQQIIGIGEHQYGLFIKREFKHNKETYLLVCVQLESRVWQVHQAFTLLPDLIEVVQTLEPLILLQQLIDRYGLYVRIGHQQTKFILEDYLVFDDNDSAAAGDPLKLIAVINPENHSFVQSMFFKVERWESLLIFKFALVWAIDRELYRTWLQISGGVEPSRPGGS